MIFFGGGSKVFLSQDPQWNFNILQVCVSCKKYILKTLYKYNYSTTEIAFETPAPKLSV